MNSEKRGFCGVLGSTPSSRCPKHHKSSLVPTYPELMLIIARLKEMGVTGVYGPGASTEDIIRDVRAALALDEKA